MGIEQPLAVAPSRTLTIGLLVVSILGILFCIGGVLGLLILLATGNNDTSGMGDSSLLISMIGVLVAVILLTIPSLVNSVRSLAHAPSRQPMRYGLFVATLALLLVPFLVFLGTNLPANLSGEWFTAAISIPTVLVPVWWFLELGRLRLSSGSSKRYWGLSTFSFFITLPLIIIVEIVVLGIGLLFGVLWLIQQPEFAPVLSQIGGQFPFDPGALENLSFDFIPLLQRHEVIAAVIVAIALVVPIIEEILKPLGLWLLQKRGLTPAEGFTAGLICGAAFALLESLFSISATLPGDWLFTIVGRAGTGLLHIFTAGLNGWALASTWRDGNPLRVGVSYIITVLIHGAWNFFAVLMGLDMAGEELPRIVDPALSGTAVYVLIGLVVVMLVSLIVFNLRLRHGTTPPPLPFRDESGLG